MSNCFFPDTVQLFPRKDLYGGRDFLEAGVEETDYEESEEEKGVKLGSYCNNREKRRQWNLLYNQDGTRRGILGGMDEDGKGRHSHVSNILLASLIHRYAHFWKGGVRERYTDVVLL